MIKRTVNFNDFDGIKQKKDLWFHLTKLEAIKIVGKHEDWTSYINDLVLSKDFDGILAVLERVILDAYGKRIDGKFVKSPAIREEFSYSEEYSELFVELMQDEKKLAKFFKDLTPSAEEQKQPVKRAPRSIN